MTTVEMKFTLVHFFFFSSRRRHTRFDCDWSSDVCSSDLDQYARDNMAQFQGKGVTTLIWPGGLETKQSQAAALIGYRPEIVLAGDRLIEIGRASCRERV